MRYLFSVTCVAQALAALLPTIPQRGNGSAVPFHSKHASYPRLYAARYVNSTTTNAAITFSADQSTGVTDDVAPSRSSVSTDRAQATVFPESHRSTQTTWTTAWESTETSVVKQSMTSQADNSVASPGRRKTSISRMAMTSQHLPPSEAYATSHIGKPDRPSEAQGIGLSHDTRVVMPSSILPPESDLVTAPHVESNMSLTAPAEEATMASVMGGTTVPLAEDKVTGVSLTLSAQPTLSPLQRPLVEAAASTKQSVESVMDSAHSVPEGFTVHQPMEEKTPTSPLTVPAPEVSDVTAVIVPDTSSVFVATVSTSSLVATDEVASNTATQKSSEAPNATIGHGVSKFGSDGLPTTSREPNENTLESGGNNPTPKQQAFTAGIVGGAAILAITCGAVVFLVFHRRRRRVHPYKQFGPAKSDNSLDFQCVGLKQP